MSAASSVRALEVEDLADAGAQVAFVESLAELPRLRSNFPGVTGIVSGGAHFGRRGGIATAELEFSGSARLTCQRCLGPMDVTLRRRVQVGLVASEDAAEGIDENLEPMLAPEGRVRIADLVEEELLLALPIVPLHEADAECHTAHPSGTEEIEPEPTSQRPFAQLKELMKGN